MWGGFWGLLFGAAFYSIGIPKDSIVQYETAVKTGKLLLIVHGTAAEVEHARELLHQTQAHTMTVHAESAAVSV